MKKFLIAILALVYISTSTGATLHMHYCMGQLADWGLVQKESKTCSKCGMKKSEKKDNSCCKDKHTFLKNDTDQKFTESSFQLVKLTTVSLPVGFIEMNDINFPVITVKNPLSHSPPRTGAVAVYILNCVFRI